MKLPESRAVILVLGAVVLAGCERAAPAAKSASPPTMTMIVSSGIFVTIFSQPEKNVSMIVFG